MATNPTAQFWIRTDSAGNSNGGSYDSGIAGAGTNYADQAAAQASWPNLSLAAGVIVDGDSLGLFTSAMIGNAINVGANGYYWVTGVTNSNTVTVLGSTGSTTSFSGLTGNLGGAFRDIITLNNGGTAGTPNTPTPLVPGNQVNVRASGSGSVGSPDYSQSGYATYPAGDATDGCIQWVTYNGTPYIVGNGLLMYQMSNHKFSGIYFSASGTNFITLGILNFLTTCSLDESCTIDGNSQSGAVGVVMTTTSTIIGAVLIGGSGTGDAVQTNQYNNHLNGARITGWGGWGVLEKQAATSTTIVGCIIAGNTSGGIYLLTSTTTACSVQGCTIDGNTGPGIEMASTAVASLARLLDNNITTNGTYGIKVDSGTAAQNTAAIAFCDYNNVHGNTSGNYSGINAGAHDLSVDPMYVGGSPYDYTPTNTALKGTALEVPNP